MHGDVERRRRLVGDQQPGLAGDRHGDHHALLLSAGQFVRIGADARLRFGNADLVHQLDHAIRQAASRQVRMEPQHFLDLPADREYRIQRGHRLLEDDRDVLAADLAQFVFGSLAQVAPGERNPAVDADDRVLGKQPDDRHRRDALARTRLAHQRQRAVLRHVEADVPHRLDDPVLAQSERDFEVLDGNECAHRVVPALPISPAVVLKKIVWLCQRSFSDRIGQK